MKDFQTTGILTSGNEGDKCLYPYRIDTYGCGCAHDCSYCYAKSLLEFRKLWNPQDPAVGNISKIAKELSKIPPNVKAVRLGGMTDCFQPIEKIHRVTYKAIRLLNKRRIPYLIVTKSDVVADDEYIRIMDKDFAHIQVTVTTLNDELAKTYEKAYNTILGQNYIFVIGSLIAYFASQTWDVWVFHKIRDAYIKKHGTIKGGRWIWNNGSTMTSQIIDTVLFIGISFGIGFRWFFIPEMHKTLAAMMVGQYVLKFILAALDTPFFYLLTRREENGKRTELATE